MTTPVAVTVLASDLAGVRENLRAGVLLALLAVNNGATVEVSLTYRKQTKSAPRIAGQDYVELPGIGMDVFFGTLTGSFRTKAGALRFRVNSGARSMGGENGWLTVIPEGLTGFAVTRILTPAPVATPAPTGAA